AIRAADIDFARSCGAPQRDVPTRHARTTHRNLWQSPGLLTFAACLFLFQLANAAMLPLVGAALVYDGESRSSLIVAALIILPQIVVALLAPWVGRQARSWGRRPLLLIGFGALPIRALLFALIADPLFLVGFQLLDGISGAVVGVLMALVTADITHATGRFNLAQGIIGTASGIGAALSTALFGLIAPNFGPTATFQLLGWDGWREASVSGRCSSSGSGVCCFSRCRLPSSHTLFLYTTLFRSMASAGRLSACSWRWSLPTLRTPQVDSIWLKESLELRPASALPSALHSLA